MRVMKNRYSSTNVLAAGKWDKIRYFLRQQQQPAVPPGRHPSHPWTEEEHKAFLAGLHQFGKGDWRSISRSCVKTRTRTQVASHAHKYLLRQQQHAAEHGRERRRVSIHDIAASDGAMPVAPARSIGLGRGGHGHGG